jgi:AcrR family transcriptional regulator
VGEPPAADVGLVTPVLRSAGNRLQERPGRNALLDAGQRLLGSADLARISVNAIVAEAGMAKGSFYQHWPSRAEYVRALHARFHDDLQDSIAAAMSDLPPGRERLEAGMNAYLDGCLAEPATKALLVRSRTEAGLSDLVAARPHR